MDIAVLLVTMFFCFLIGVPIAYSLGLAAIAASFWIGIPLEAVMLQISNGVSKVAMLTIPFFVLAGAIMAEGGMARRMVAFADVLVGFTRVRGGLSVVNVLATTLLSGISGSSVADVSAIGSVMIPQMERSGYPRVYATNVTITGSVQALLVPPSHNAIIYSLATGGSISIISLFIAGVVPGLLLGFSIIVLCLVIAYRDGHPSDLKGIKFRAAGPTFASMWENAGASIVSPPSNEIYNAFQSGVVNGTDTSLGTFQSMRLYEVTNCLTAPGNNALWFMYEPVLMSKKSFDKLNKAQQDAVLKAGKAAQAYYEGKADDVNKAAIKSFEDHKVKVVTLSDADYQAWLDVAKKSSYARFAKDVPNGQKLIDEALAVK